MIVLYEGENWSVSKEEPRMRQERQWLYMQQDSSQILRFFHLVITKDNQSFIFSNIENCVQYLLHTTLKWTPDFQTGHSLQVGL